MINERADFRKDLEDVLNSYVSKIGVQDILSELYPLLKHTEFKYAIMLRDLYLIKEEADAPPVRELTDEEIKHCFEKTGFVFHTDILLSWAKDVAKEIIKASRGGE
jgi:hypothetical protein